MIVNYFTVTIWLWICIIYRCIHTTKKCWKQLKGAMPQNQHLGVLRQIKTGWQILYLNISNYIMIDHQSEKNDCFWILELSFIKLYDCIMDNLYLSNPVIVRVKSKAQSYFCVLINNIIMTLRWRQSHDFIVKLYGQLHPSPLYPWVCPT